MGGTHLEHPDTKNVPMQRGARLPFRRSAPMQRGARFAIFDVPFGASCWVQRWRQKQCKTIVFLLILNMNGAPAAATKWIPKPKKCKIHKENECFARVPWELLGVHLGWSLFMCAHLGSSNWRSRKVSKAFKNNGSGHFGGCLLGGSIWTFRSARAFSCSVALVFRLAGALPCSVALM